MSQKTQTTFGAFSGASPFSKPSSSTSAFGSASDKPSAFGSGSNSAAKPFSSSGFGGFSGSASPFGAKKPSAFGTSQPSSKAGASTSAFDSKTKGIEAEDNEQASAERKSGDAAVGEQDDSEASAAGPSKNFGDILSGSGAPEDEAGSSKVQMMEQDGEQYTLVSLCGNCIQPAGFEDMTDVHTVVTGEEDETTKFQMRTKLYVMQSDNSWRERGVGLLRLNVRRQDGQGARLGQSRHIQRCLGGITKGV